MTKHSFSMLARASVGFAALCLPLAAQAATVVANFAGINLNQTIALGSGASPPDTMGAIGTNHFVEFINGGYQVYNRNGSTAGALITDSQFWLNAGISSSLVNQGLSDTRIKFDVQSQRWFATEITLGAVQTANTAADNSVLIGVSKTANPLDGWNSTSFNVAGVTKFNDYPTLAVDANAIYVGTNDFNPALNAFTGVTLTSIPKASLLLAAPTTAGLASFSQVTGTPSLGSTPQAVTNDGSGYTGTKIFGNSETSPSAIQITTLNNTAAAGATLGASTTKTVTFDSATKDSRQPDGTRQIDGLDNRFSGTIYQVGNLIYAVNAVNRAAAGGGAGDTNAVHYLVLNATTNAIVQEGLITDGARDLWQPSIAANAAGDVVIGYNKSGADTFISSYAAVGHTVGGVLTFEAPLLLQAGTVNYHLFGGAGERWGDYSATMVDPTDSSVFWTIQELPFSSNRWGTQISAIRVTPAAAVPEPASWALMLAGFGLVGASLRRKRLVVSFA